jgi:hypothetical protein
LPATATGAEVKTRLLALQTTVELGPKSWKTIVPVGATPAAMVAVSNTEFPITTFPEACVASVGVAWLTTTVSFASPQAPVIGLLFASPEYEAIQRYVPIAVGVYSGVEV